MRESFVVKELRESLAELDDVTRRIQKAVIPVPNYIPGVSDVGHDGRQPARHRFQQRDRETLVARRQDEHTRSRVEVGDVFPKAEELNVVLDS
jgi:hypothetical protein